MATALSDGVFGPNVSSANMKTNTNISFTKFQSYIQDMNNANVDILYIHVSAHGGNNYVFFGNEPVKADEFANAVALSNSDEIYISISSCKSGSMLDELNRISTKITAVSATDAFTDVDGWQYINDSDGNSYFIEDFSYFLTDPESDTNEDGMITYEEAYIRVITDGRQISKQNSPNIKHVTGGGDIPTLSEWKRIFLILFLISSSFAFIRHRQYASPSLENPINNTVLYRWGNAIFEDKNYNNLMKW